MRRRLALLALLTALAAPGCVGALQGGTIGTAEAPRPLEVHTCVPAATVWVDGFAVPIPAQQHVVADASGTAALPALDAHVGLFTLHATAAGRPDYAAQLTTLAAPGERIVIVLDGCVQ